MKKIKKSEVSKPEIIIDATMGVVGRMASFAAKKALLGNKVIIVNCNEAIVTGPKNAVIAVYKMKRTYGGTSQKGPYYSRTPDRMMRKAVRGMLPWSRTRGREAYRNVICFPAMPVEYASKEKLTFKKKMRASFMSLKEISKLM